MDRETAILIGMKRMAARLGAIALLALVMRAIVPAGYVLAEADTGQGRYLTVEMCDGHNHAPQVIDLDTGKRVDPANLGGHSGKPDPKQPCVFAAAAAMAQPVPVAEPVEFLAVQHVEFAAQRELRPGRGIAAPPPPATGPPSLI